MQPAGLDEAVGSSPNTLLETGFAAQHRRRHAVHIAGGRRQRRVEVRMSVEPKHEEFAPRLGRMPRHAADRTHREAVIAAKHDRGAPGVRNRVGLPRQDTRPGGHMGEPIAPCLRWRRRGLDEGDGEPRGRPDLQPHDRGRSDLTIPAVRSIAGPIAEPGTLAPASTGAPKTAIARESGKVALASRPSSAVAFRSQDVSFRVNSGGACRERMGAPNEGKLAPSETIRSGKPLKSLGTKSRDFAETFVFNNLIGSLLRRFRQGLSRKHDAPRPLAISRPLIIADNSEERKNLSGLIFPPARTRVLTTGPHLSIACAP